MSSRRLPVIVSYAACAYVHTWGLASRFESNQATLTRHTIPKEGPFIFSFWHSRQIFPLYYYRNTGIATLVSKSRDGEFITQTMARVGMNVSRGSSSRAGTEGMLGLLHWLKKGRSVAVTPDGPRGPREVVRPGIIHLSRLAGIPIVPASWASSRCIRVKSWDRFMVPLPFGRVCETVGDPIHVPKDASDELLEEKRLELQNEMRRITAISDEILSPSQRIAPESDSR